MGAEYNVPRDMTTEQVLELADKIKAAQQDTTPVAVVNEDKITVFGDANKTEIKKVDLEMHFRMPKDVFDRLKPKADGVKEVGRFVIYKKEFDDFYLTPRNDAKVMSAFVKVLPFFLKIREDAEGELDNLTNEECLHVVAAMKDELVLAMYNVAYSVLNLSEEEAEWMMLEPAFKTVALLIETYPEMVNEADFFSGYSTGSL